VITKGTTSVIPHQNWRGQFARGTWGVNSSNAVVGAKTECANSGSTGCLWIPWPGQRTNVRHAIAGTEPIQNWFGGLVDGMRDASGQMYMRNRYYDPASGQFTQPDPIGLAGGLNAYGFAAGDPVGHSDPYGLCTIQLRTNAIGGAAGKLGANHAYIVTIAPDNTRTHFRGGPEGGELGSSGSSQSGGGASSERSGSTTDSANGTSPGAGPHEGSRGPLGAVRADREPGDGGETDRPSAANPLTSSTTVLSNDESCKKYHLRMGAEMLRINYTEAPYNPLGRNSNSVARTLLRSIGIKNVRPPVWVPGWDSDLYY
jgi:RHS repeat-associated protein